jgi:hypothetical protein
MWGTSILLLGKKSEKEHMLRRLATSLVLIAAVAFGARVVFAWHQIAQIPRDVVGTVPFQTETGHIAYSLATGKGFASPFQRDSGPTAWLAPVYPLVVAGIFKIFGVYTHGSFFAAISLASLVCRFLLRARALPDRAWAAPAHGYGRYSQTRS